MNSTAQLTGSLLRTYNTIFQHPVSHNLEWRHVHALFRHVAEVEEENNGSLRVTRNGQTLVLHPPSSKDVAETEELMALRHFLQRSEPTAAVPDDGTKEQRQAANRALDARKRLRHFGPGAS